MRQFAWPADRAELTNFFEQAESHHEQVERRVEEIIAAVRRRGDVAVAEFTKAFDRAELKPGEFDVPASRLAAAWAATPPKLKRALQTAKRRILAFHKTQALKGWTIREPGFGRIDQRVLPLA